MKFSADTHFGSQRVLELSRRPFNSTMEMDKELIRLWNETIAPGEEVYHLGDFGNYEIIKKLNGNIHLILGNYELKDIQEKKISIEKLLDCGFVSVENNIYLDNFNPELEKVKKIKLVHKPSECDIDNPEVFNLYGHIHGRQLCKRFGLDVGVDGHHFKPVSAEDVCYFSTTIKKYYDDEVFL